MFLDNRHKQTCPAPPPQEVWRWHQFDSGCECFLPLVKNGLEERKLDASEMDRWLMLGARHVFFVCNLRFKEWGKSSQGLLVYLTKVCNLDIKKHIFCAVWCICFRIRKSPNSSQTEKQLHCNPLCRTLWLTPLIITLGI